jgi:hypothetical protein
MAFWKERNSTYLGARNHTLLSLSYAATDWAREAVVDKVAASATARRCVNGCVIREILLYLLQLQRIIEGGRSGYREPMPQDDD